MRTLKIIFFIFTVLTIVNSTAYADPLIRIELSEQTLILLENDLEIKRYPIATPHSNWYVLPLKGKIIRIERNPIWYPTLKTRIAYFKKKGINLPAVVKPGHPRNAMGKVKFIIKFQNFSEPIRLHGTNDPASIGKKVTRGCIRMHNENALELAKTIEKKLPVSLIIEN